MDNAGINVILQSTMIGTIVSAIVAAVVSILTSRKAQSLKYVTGERQAWREKIREIAEMLNGANRKGTSDALAKLKCRINSLGNCKNGEYMNDAHIWKLIHELEDNNLSSKKLHQKQNLLIEYLSLLLKYDWERSKKEVYGNVYRMAGMVMYAVTAIAFVIYVIIYNVYKMPLTDYMLFMLGITSMMVCWYIVLNIVIDAGIKVEQRYYDTRNADKYRKHSLLRCYGKYILCNIILAVTLLSWFKDVFYIKDIQTYMIENGIDSSAMEELLSQRTLCVVVLMILYICGVVLMTVSKMPSLHLRYNYINSINELKKDII